MYPTEPHPHIVRIVTGDSGTVEFETEFVVRFGYGEQVPWVTMLPDRRLRAVAGPNKLILQSTIELRGEDFKTKGKFTVKAGETASFALTYGESFLPDPPAADFTKLLPKTEQYWKDWASQCDVEGPYANAVKRSLITLKAMTYAPTGGVVAAMTTSLPEQFGGPRNWDYRYCWLRDATLTLLALMNTGYFDEARAWREWLLRAVAGSPDQMQIMYGIAGERRLYEVELPWLPGYEKSAPVRIGNGAHQQTQIDVYGELLDALHQARKGGLAPEKSGWDLQLAILEHLERRLAEARPGHLGGAQRTGALHLFQGHGLGRLRPLDQERRTFQAEGPHRSLARHTQRPFTLRSARRATTRSSIASSAPTEPRWSTPASCCFRRSASCRRATRALLAPSSRSRRH